MKDYDFSGYATKNDIRCADGRVIRHDAFKENDGQIVPLVWQHVHTDPMNVLGHALLENRDDGVYAYATLNNTESGKHAREMVKNGDIVAMSIFANRLQQQGSDVVHGVIREVSLVLAGANPGALIDNISLAHAEADGSTNYVDIDDEAVIYSGLEDIQYFSHADDSDNDSEESNDKKEGGSMADKTVQDVFDTLNDEQKDAVYFLVGQAVEQAKSGKSDDDEMSHADDDEMSHADDADDSDDDSDDRTVQDVFDELTEEQKNVVYFLIGQALENANGTTKKTDDGGNSMKHNVFDEAYENEADVLTHDEFTAIMADAGKSSSLKDVFLQHGITGLDVLFPEAQMVRPQPDMITRNMGWVDLFWNALHRTPFSRIKSVYANLTADDARAKGYVKGTQKVDQVLGMLARETSPQTIYKKQTLDRDDVIDITSIDVIAWLKQELRMMLNEELCRAMLVSDGRGTTAPYKIKTDRIRPIYGDDPVYTIYYELTYGVSDTDDQKASKLIDACVRARKDYKGSGDPWFFATNEVIADLLLAKDTIGRRLYKDMNELQAALRVSKIVEVPVMDGVTRARAADAEAGITAATMDLLALIVNPKDYTIGADKGGAVSLFDDFDIDYNQMKYLIETRCSGALTLPYSAIAIEKQHPVSNSTGNDDDQS